ncbi:MAG: hypothetical protein ACAI43_23115 [Phycisphaerae bacterium]|nr:hypothetical protein [Tepidisphaeraceae bacterium]
MTRRMVILVLSIVCGASAIYFAVRTVGKPGQVIASSDWPFDSMDDRSRGRDIEALVSAGGVRATTEGTHVEAIRIDADRQDSIFWHEGAKVTVQRTEVVPPDLARSLATLLTDPKGYAFQRGSKRCGGFQPRHAVRFRTSADSKADVCYMICFKCADLQVVRHDEEGRPVHRAMSDIQPMQAELKKLVLRALPGDKYLEAAATREAH